MSNEPDIYGRVWMHCESGLTMTKASMARFMIHILSNKIELGQIYAFNPKYSNSLVLASVRIRPDQIEAFEKETKAKLRHPPEVHVNSIGSNISEETRQRLYDIDQNIRNAAINSRNTLAD